MGTSKDQFVSINKNLFEYEEQNNLAEPNVVFIQKMFYSKKKKKSDKLFVKVTKILGK